MRSHRIEIFIHTDNFIKKSHTDIVKEEDDDGIL